MVQHLFLSINPHNYSALSDDDRLNVTLAPLVDRAMEMQQSLTDCSDLPPIVEEVF